MGGVAGAAGWPTAGPAPAPRGGRRGRDRRPRPRRGAWCSSTPPPGSPTGCRRPASRPSSTTCSTSSCPADTLAAAADRGEAVRLLTAHAAKGLEWDLVVVAGVQEGVWPDLRLRGSVLGSERLVDVAAGRDTTAAAASPPRSPRCWTRSGGCSTSPPPGPAGALLVTAVDPSTTGSGGEEQPSRFLAELAVDGPVDLVDAADAPARSTQDAAVDRAAAPAAHPARAGRRAAHARSPTRTSRPTPARGRRPAAPGWPTAGVPGRRPRRVVGAAPAVRRRAAGRPGDAGPGLAVHSGELRCGAACGGCSNATAAATRRRPSRASATWSTRRPCWSPTRRPAPAEAAVRAYVADRFDQIELPARWLGQRRAATGPQDGRQAAGLADRQPARADRDRAGVRRQLDAVGRRTGAGRRGPGRPARTRRARAGCRGRPQDRRSAPERGRRASIRSCRLPGGGRGRARSPSTAPCPAAPRSSRSAPATPRRQYGCSRRWPTADDPTLGRGSWSGEAATAMAASTFRARGQRACPYCPVRTPARCPARAGR